MTGTGSKQLFRRAGAVVFWLVVWQCAAMAIGQEVFLVSPVQALRTLLGLLPQAAFWRRVGFSSGRILLGFGLGAAAGSLILLLIQPAGGTAGIQLTRFAHSFSSLFLEYYFRCAFAYS